MTNEQISLRLAEIYRSLNRIQDLADAFMYDPFLSTEIKEVLLNWYESNLDLLKNELFAISKNDFLGFFFFSYFFCTGSNFWK